MRSRLQMRRLPMRRGHLRHRLRRLCRLHMQLQLLHIVGILRMALLDSSTFREPGARLRLSPPEFRSPHTR
jgi:hypothetical protein